MKKLSCNEKFNHLIDYGYFTWEELCLCIAGWGDNDQTYDTICHVRFGMDFDQLYQEDEEMWRL